MNKKLIVNPEKIGMVMHDIHNLYHRTKLPGLKRLIEERDNQIKELRLKGYTYKAIGNEMKISKQRVSQIIFASKKRDDNKNKWTSGLSTRNVLLMEKLGVEDKATAIMLIETREIVPFKWPNFGRRSYHDLCAWLDTQPIDPGLGRHCPHCGKTSKQ